MYFTSPGATENALLTALPPLSTGAEIVQFSIVVSPWFSTTKVNSTLVSLGTTFLSTFTAVLTLTFASFLATLKLLEIFLLSPLYS